MFFLVLLWSLIGAQSLPPISNQLPFNASYFTDTVASVQNTYCYASDNVVGQRIGDQVLLSSIEFDNGAQRVNIYESPSLGVVVAYQGTNVTNFDSIIHNVDLFQVMPSSELGLAMDALLFAGWQDQWRSSWSEVESVLRGLNLNKVVVVGHSQGAAIAQLGALAIHNTFGDVVDKVIGYGPPRVGNLAYAEAFDSVFSGKYTGVTNGQDWVYSVPPKELGFVHPSGMVWINPANSTSWTYYSDREDPRGPDGQIPEYVSQTSIQSAPFLYFQDHLGIYIHSSLGGRRAGPCPAVVGGY